MFLESIEGFLTFVFGAQNSCFWIVQKVSFFLVPRIHIFGESKRFPDICFWCPQLMFLESPEGFLTFVFAARNSCFWRVQKAAWLLFLVPKTHVFREPRRFPLFFWCPKLMFLESPEGFLPFVFGAQVSYSWRAQKVSWHLFLVPKIHVFGEPRCFPDICFWCPNFLFLESPEGFLTFVFGAQNSCFWRVQKVSWHLLLVPKIHVFGEPRRFPDICFWCSKLMFLESPEGFLTFVFGAQNSYFWRAQKVFWHLFLVPKTQIFGEPKRFPDICFWCPKLTFLESPEGFLTFVFGAQDSYSWRAQKISCNLFLVPNSHVFGEPRRFPDICFLCPTVMFLESPEGFLTFVFGAQISCFGEPRRFPDIWFWCPKLIFLESPQDFLTFVFGAQNSCFWRAQKISWHLFWAPKTHVLGEPRRFPDICFWCPNFLFLKSPEDFLTFVVGAQNTYFWRAQKISWHLFLVPKTHIFGAPRRLPDICSWCPNLIFLESPEGFLTFVFGAQNSCFSRAQKVSWHLLLEPKTHVFGESRRFPDICFWCPKLMFWRTQKVSWHLILVPKTHVFGEPTRFPDICFWWPKLMFLESPEGFLAFFWYPKLMVLESPKGFLTFVFGAQNSYFWRAQKVSWHLFLVPKTHIFGESRRLPDICFWCPKLMFLQSPEDFLTFVLGAQNSCFWRAQKVSWHLFLVPKTHVFGAPRRFPLFFGAQNSCFGRIQKVSWHLFLMPKFLIFWRAQKISWHLLLVPKTHIFEEPRRCPDFCFWFPKLIFLERPEGFLTFVVGAQISYFGEPRRFPDICFWCPKLMFLDSPEGFLTFVIGAQNSRFWRAQKVSWQIFFGAQNSCFWRVQKVSWHLILVPKTHIFGEPRRFPDICVWCPELIFLESPKGFLTFALGAQNSCFWRAQKVYWRLFLVPKTHVFGEPRRFPDIHFWCPKLMFLKGPEGFLPFVFGAQNSCFWTAQKASWHLFLVPKNNVFGEPRGFLTFVFGAQNSCFWRAQTVC